MPSRVTRRARRLRRDATDAERVLWRALRELQTPHGRFRRQHRIGSYVVDFACTRAALVIAVDGGQHSCRADADAARTAFLKSQGCRVIRFWNNDVLNNLEGVVQRIQAALAEGG
jgi:very-short-patch-repair endonuclease